MHERAFRRPYNRRRLPAVPAPRWPRAAAPACASAKAPPSPGVRRSAPGYPRGILRLVRRAPRRVLLLVDRHDAVHVAHVLDELRLRLETLDAAGGAVASRRLQQEGLLGLVVASLRRVRVDASGAGRPEPRRSFDAGALRTLFLFLSAAAAAAFSLRILLVSVNSASSFSAMVRSMFVPLLMCIL